MLRALWQSCGGGQILMSEVPLYHARESCCNTSPEVSTGVGAGDTFVVQNLVRPIALYRQRLVAPRVVVSDPLLASRFRAKRELPRFEGILPESLGQNLDLSVLFVPYLLGSGNRNGAPLSSVWRASQLAGADQPSFCKNINAWTVMLEMRVLQDPSPGVKGPRDLPCQAARSRCSRISSYTSILGDIRIWVGVP